jgi:hypothetical protein
MSDGNFNEQYKRSRVRSPALNKLNKQHQSEKMSQKTFKKPGIVVLSVSAFVIAATSAVCVCASPPSALLSRRHDVDDVGVVVVRVGVRVVVVRRVEVELEQAVEVRAIATMYPFCWQDFHRVKSFDSRPGNRPRNRRPEFESRLGIRK